MNISASKLEEGFLVVSEPVSAEVRYSLTERDGETFAELSKEDLLTLYEKLPNGASRSERGDIECYLCGVAEEGQK